MSKLIDINALNKNNNKILNNLNIFSNITNGTNIISATNKSDTLTIIGNIVDYDVNNKKLTIDVTPNKIGAATSTEFNKLSNDINNMLFYDTNGDLHLKGAIQGLCIETAESGELSLNSESSIYIADNNGTDLYLYSNYIEYSPKSSEVYLNFAKDVTYSYAGWIESTFDSYVNINDINGHLDINVSEDIGIYSNAMIQLQTKKMNDVIYDRDIVLDAYDCLDLYSRNSHIYLQTSNVSFKIDTDISLKLQSMTTPVTLKAYIQGVVNGTY